MPRPEVESQKSRISTVYDIIFIYTKAEHEKLDKLAKDNKTIKYWSLTRKYVNKLINHAKALYKYES